MASECEAGNGDDVILLQPGAVYTMTGIENDPFAVMGPTATPVVLSTIVIEARGAQLVRANPNRDFAGVNFRAFAVANAFFVDPNGEMPIAGDGRGKLTIREAFIKGFTAKGGDGESGGGGGLGAGGAIYVTGAELTVEWSTFQDNGAGGGNGSPQFHDSGGGGGGMGGHGGEARDDALHTFEGPGGGGGGARGNGGANGWLFQFQDPPLILWDASLEGGGGGGTLTDGQVSGVRGFRCGGNGGNREGNGESAICPGGGGGGGGQPNQVALVRLGGDGGDGGYGGGGGGGGYHHDPIEAFRFGRTGGAGGFGGGGGAGGSGDEGGGGGFGGGGGSGDAPAGSGGTFGGNGNGSFGGGGAGLGGAIFGDISTVTIRNSTFAGNFAVLGNQGGPGAQNGDGDGGAVFAVDGVLTILNSTFSGSETAGTGDGGAVSMYRSTRGFDADLEIRNSIIINSLPATDECDLSGSVSFAGSGNIIGNTTLCADGSESVDPALGPLQLNAPGLTPTMAIDAGSPAFDTGDSAFCALDDQRGVARPQGSGCDVGAYEFIELSANLTIAKRTLGTAIAGRTLTYAIDVQNLGPTDAHNVTMTDTLPPGVSLVSMIGGGFTCTGTTTVTCTKGTMTVGEMALFTLTVQIPSSLSDGALLTNQASVGSSTVDPVPANNATSVTASVVTRADLAVAKSLASSVVAGADVQYAIALTNHGPSDAQAVDLSDIIAAGTTFRSVTAPSGWSCVIPTIGAGGPAPVTCSRTTLAANATAVFTLTVRPASSAVEGSLLCNTAGATTATVDPVPANNTSQACGAVLTRADLQLTQVVTTQGRAGKGTATFDLTVRNLGPSDSQNIALVATSSLFVGPSPPAITASPGATCLVTGPTVTCTWPVLAALGSTAARLTVPWKSAVGQVCESGSVSAGTFDPNATNNHASACIGKK